MLCSTWITVLLRIQKNMNSLNSTQVHNADDDGCFDEEQYEEIDRLSQESLERWRNAVLPTWTQTNISHLCYSPKVFLLLQRSASSWMMRPGSSSPQNELNVHVFQGNWQQIDQTSMLTSCFMVEHLEQLSLIVPILWKKFFTNVF